MTDKEIQLIVNYLIMFAGYMVFYIIACRIINRFCETKQEKQDRLRKQYNNSLAVIHSNWRIK